MKLNGELPMAAYRWEDELNGWDYKSLDTRLSVDAQSGYQTRKPGVLNGLVVTSRTSTGP